MPTVKSLDERIDGLAEDFTGLRIEVVEIKHGLVALKNQVDEVARRLTALEAQVSRLVEEMAAFRARVDTNIAVVRILMVFVLGLAGTAMFQSFDVARQAGRMEANVNQLQETVRKHDALIAEQNKLFQDIRADLADLKARVK